MGSLVVLSGIAVLGLFVYLLYRIYDRIYDRRIASYQNKLLQNEMDEVHNIYLTMRGWRHDYHNHMQSLKAYLAMDDLAGAEAYLDLLEQDLDDIGLLFDTGNLNADAVLNAKISLAIKKGIRVDHKATVPRELAVSDIDLCVVIGNLIDNAVEACEKAPPEDRFIRLYIGILRRQLYLSVCNATAETVRRRDEEYVTAKRGDHGHGLKRIDRIVDRYGGYIDRKNEPGVFVTEILFPL